MSQERAEIILTAKELSSVLKEFHRALIRSEIGDDPELQNPYTMLFALIGDPRFEWMGTLSDLITRIDQAIVDDELADQDTLKAFQQEASFLIGEGENTLTKLAAFRLRHVMALQREPDVGLATGRLRRLVARPAMAA